MLDQCQYNYRLIIHPDVDQNNTKSIILGFRTKDEMDAVIYSCSRLLIFLRDDIKLMPERSNIFLEEKWNGYGWEEFEFSQV